MGYDVTKYTKPFWTQSFRKETNMAKYKKIFAALDDGGSRLAVARRTLSIAHDNNAQVLFAHAIDASLLEQAGVSSDEMALKSGQALEESLERQLTRAMHDECIPSVEVRVEAGRTEDVLGELAEEFKPDLVICGVRGLSNVKYAFVGSVSTYLVRHMDCDVLVVRPESIDELDEDEYAQAENAAD